MNELNFLDSLFNDLMGTTGTVNSVYHAAVNTPRVDVKEESNGYTLEMELPGRCENDVNIELDHDNLTISSKEETKKENDKENKKTQWILKERKTCSFTRRFTLPSDVDSESITANFKNGLLTISMQKKAIAAPKKILIESAS